MDLIRSLIEIIIISILFYYLLISLRGTRGAGILKGLIFITVITFLVVVMSTRFFKLSTLHYILKEWFFLVLVFALVVIFQQELRRSLLRLGQSRLLNPFFSVKSEVITEIIEAALKLSKNRVGALITLEREISLKPYIEGGVQLNAQVSSELLQTIFHPGSPLHDGAVIIREDRIMAAGCLFPLTDNPEISKSVGTRHRSGIGITEESDALVVIVSEETGRISIGVKGQLTTELDETSLQNMLEGLYLKEEKVLTKNKT
ncbi:MAG: diadenylate cyclase CdaA [Planctomycetota bacterium]